MPTILTPGLNTVATVLTRSLTTVAASTKAYDDLIIRTVDVFGCALRRGGGRREERGEAACRAQWRMGTGARTAAMDGFCELPTQPPSYLFKVKVTDWEY